MTEEERFLEGTESQLNVFLWHGLSNSYQDIHNAGKCKDKNCAKESEEVSLGGEGGHEEADQGDAADVGGEQGEQGQEHLHCSSHLPNDLIQSFFLIFAPDF